MAKAKKPSSKRNDTRKAPYSNVKSISKRAAKNALGNIRDIGMKPKTGKK